MAHFRWSSETGAHLVKVGVAFPCRGAVDDFVSRMFALDVRRVRFAIAGRQWNSGINGIAFGCSLSGSFVFRHGGEVRKHVTRATSWKPQDASVPRFDTKTRGDVQGVVHQPGCGVYCLDVDVEHATVLGLIEAIRRLSGSVEPVFLRNGAAPTRDPIPLQIRR